MFSPLQEMKKARQADPQSCLGDGAQDDAYHGARDGDLDGPFSPIDKRRNQLRVSPVLGEELGDDHDGNASPQCGDEGCAAFKRREIEQDDDRKEVEKVGPVEPGSGEAPETLEWLPWSSPWRAASSGGRKVT